MPRPALVELPGDGLMAKTQHPRGAHFPCLAPDRHPLLHCHVTHALSNTSSSTVEEVPTRRSNGRSDQVRRPRVLLVSIMDRAMRIVPTFSAPAALPNHVALCIGNSKYASSPLQNAAHDAEDVAALCRKLGFSTELVLEASLERMLGAVEAFVERLTKGGVALFFYAGARRHLRSGLKSAT